MYDSICKLNIQKYMCRNPAFYALRSFSMMAFSEPRKGRLESNASHGGSEGRRSHDLWLVWRDKDFKDFCLVGAGADGGFAAFLLTGCGRSP